MEPALELTSVPAWATAPTVVPADLTGRSWSIVSFGADDVVRRWVAQLTAGYPDAEVRVHRVVDDVDASDAVAADVADAVVGWRLMVAGPADACLRVRAIAGRLGVADDELTVASTDVASRDVRCAHCRTTTRAVIGLGGVITCQGCERKLSVYHHVSRDLGAHLGFMVDAEAVAP